MSAEIVVANTDLQTVLSAIIALILALIAWYNRQRTEIQIAAATAPVPVVASITASLPAVSAPVPIATNDEKVLYSVVTNPLLLDRYATVQIGGTTYHPVFKMSPETLRAVTGQLGPADLALVTQQIAEAEAQRGNLGIPYYVIHYSKGFYAINYSVQNAGSDTYFASTIASSGHDR